MVKITADEGKYSDVRNVISKGHQVLVVKITVWLKLSVWQHFILKVMDMSDSYDNWLIKHIILLSNTIICSEVIHQLIGTIAVVPVGYL